MPSPQVRFESMDLKGCLPVLPIPNRPPFAVRVEPLGDNELRVHLQQLPDAYPESLFEVTVSGATLQLLVNPKNPVQGGASCDTVVRISNVPAGIVTLRVDRRNPGAAEVFTLGSAPVPRRAK